MAQKNYKVNEAIDVVYQSNRAKTGLTDVTMEIYDETGAKDIVNFPDVVMTEVGTTGRYTGTFTPDAEGEWKVMIAYNSGNRGHRVKQYSVGGYNLDDVGDLLEDIGAPPMIG